MRRWRRVWLRRRPGVRRTSWVLQWYDDDWRLRQQAVGTDADEAARRRTEKELRLNRGGELDPEPIRLGTFIGRHLATVKGELAASTLVGHREVLEALLARVGDVWLGRLGPRQIVEFRAARMAAGGALATANKELRTLRSVFARAVRDGYLAANPCAGVQRLREPEREIRVLSVEEVERLLTAAADEPEMQLLVFLLLTTGLRRGEAARLRWRDVDLETGTLYVRNTEAGQTKSRKGRALGLVPAAVEALRQWRVRTPGELVFDMDGVADRGSWMTKHFSTLIRRAKIARCSLHDLRRTFSSQLQMAGVGASVAKQLLGHASVQTTEAHYTRMLAEPLRAATARLPYATGRVLALSWQQQSEGRTRGNGVVGSA